MYCCYNQHEYSFEAHYKQEQRCRQLASLPKRPVETCANMLNIVFFKQLTFYEDNVEFHGFKKRFFWEALSVHNAFTYNSTDNFCLCLRSSLATLSCIFGNYFIKTLDAYSIFTKTHFENRYFLHNT